MKNIEKQLEEWKEIHKVIQEINTGKYWGETKREIMELLNDKVRNYYHKYQEPFNFSKAPQ